MSCLTLPRADDALLPAALAFFENGDLSAFFEVASPWIVAYVAARLNRDPDIVGDFYVHVYDRVPEYLRDYGATSREAPFTAYFAICLRNEFMNFIRPVRRQALLVQEWSEGIQPQRPGIAEACTSDGGEANERAFSARFYGKLDRLPVRLRLPMKLTHGIDPDRDDLRELIRLVGDSARAAEVIFEFHRRREVRSRKLRRIEDRMAHLSYLIDNCERRPELRGTPRLWARWKGRLQGVLAADHPLFTLNELGGMFGRNRSTIMRRVERAVILMRDGIWNEAASS